MRPPHIRDRLWRAIERRYVQPNNTMLLFFNPVRSGDNENVEIQNATLNLHLRPRPGNSDIQNATLNIHLRIKARQFIHSECHTKSPSQTKVRSFIHSECHTKSPSQVKAR